MIKGKVHLVFRDVKTGEITKEVEETNVVTNWGLDYSANGDSQTAGSGASDGDWGRWPHNILIGEWTQDTDRTFHYLHNIYAVGTVEAGVDSPRLLSGNVGEGSTFAYYYEYQQRFAPPTATRTIRTIGLQREDQGLSALQYQRPAECVAYLSLSSPCTQTPTETLDVFYRVIWNNPTPAVSGLSTEQMQILAERHANNDGDSIGSEYRVEWPDNWVEYYYHGSKMVPNASGEMVAGARLSLRDNGSGGAAYGAGNATRNLDYGITITDSLGRIYGSIAHGDSGTIKVSAFWNPVLRDFPVDSPVGNIFPHSTSATGPFYQSSGLAVGAGTMSIDGSSWTNPDFNNLMQVEITQSGLLGASEYRLHVMRTTGFIQNTYKHAEVALPAFNSWNDFDGGYLFETGTGSFIEDRGPHAMPYGRDMTKVILFTDDWVGKGDITTMERKRFHATSTPAFTGTGINQIVTVPTNNAGSLVPGDIWVADEITGLHRIFQDDSTVQLFDNTHINLTGLTSSACRGVTFTPGRIWAAFDGGLVYTSDNGTTFTVYDGVSSPTFTVADWSRIWFIQGDPVDVNHHIGVAYNEEASHLTAGRCDLRLDWWDPTAGFGNTITQLQKSTSTNQTNPWHRNDIFRVFECAPDDSVWGCSHHEANGNNPAFFAYNGTVATQTFPSYSSATHLQRYFFGWTKDLTGNDSMIVCWYHSTDSYFGFCQQDGTSTRSDVMNAFDLPEDTISNWYNTAGDEGLKCITPSGMLVMSTVGNASNSNYRYWCMRPAWQDEDDPYGGVAKFAIFDEYGWDGGAWVLNHAGNKPTHASSDTLIDGLTISFDDNVGADTFVVNDYYTVAITDGIMADGATEFDHRYCLYYKKMLFGETDVEGAGVLSASPNTYSRELENSEKDNLIDNSNVTATDGFLTGTGNPWYCRVNHTHTDEAKITYRIDTQAGLGEVFVGFAVSTKIGSTPVGTDIDYAIKLSAGVLGGTNGLKSEAISNGVVATVIDDGSQGFHTDDLIFSSNGWGNLNRNNEDYIYLTLHREEGSTDVKVYYRNALVHTFSSVTANLVPTVTSTSLSHDVRLDEIRTTTTDYIVELGDSGGVSGFFDTEFYAVDVSTPGQPRADEVLINGTPVTTLLVDDRLTALGVGEVSVLSTGHIRYSAVDTGKTLTIGRYNVMLNE